MDYSYLKGVSQGVALSAPGFITKWTVAGDATARTITLPFTSNGTYNAVVDWGDGGPASAINTYDDADRIHTYASDGTYDVEITGDAPGWSFNNAGDKLKIVEVVDFGDSSGFGGFAYLAGGFYGCANLTAIGTNPILDDSLSTLENAFRDCSSLTSIPSGLFDNCTAVGFAGFYQTFSGCTSLTSIPSGLFDNNTAVNSDGFNGTFYNCTSLTSIPSGLFNNNTLVSVNGFNWTFRGCSSLTAIPTGLFDYNTAVSNSGFSYTFYECTSLTAIPTGLFDNNTAVSTGGFNRTFYNCTSLTSIPSGLFDYNTAVNYSGFYCTFRGCTSLTSIPSGLFAYNTAVSGNGFYQTFYGCTSLTAIPSGLFDNNTAVSTNGFYQTFYNCTSLTTIPTDLFRYNTAVSTYGFWYTFYNCAKLVLNRNIFYADGEQSTRFLNQNVNFTRCFYRSSYTGSQGEAPDLWNCDFGTGTPVTTYCFGGGGNSLSSLSNYADIPAGWKF